ncbi:hypothetical protein [Brevundimonas sp. SGAir0440]|uniref:hypothetical protein n=1 Tax=Brevundimonas sp. SGAir0440 TaxID=2579977 RepID=UPI0010CD2005|nr:hypothetical protein [Brevundimonas sp. SGAir0440]QCQ97765.1 hypothetical protein E7T10_03310 [Brevundimonas sp. SGAir0440]
MNNYFRYDCALNIAGFYVVLLWDPDYSDTSPWSVRAMSKDEAIQRARADWHAWLKGDDDEDDCESNKLDDPEVFKVYANSWIGERID